MRLLARSFGCSGDRGLIKAPKPRDLAFAHPKVRKAGAWGLPCSCADCTRGRFSRFHPKYEQMRFGVHPRRRFGVSVITSVPRYSYTQSRPQLGLAARSRHITHPRTWGLCHWAGEPAGHLGAESSSRRIAGPASARKSSPRCPHRSHGSFRARCANAMSRCLRALPFASSPRSLTRTLGHSQWPKPPRFVHATAPAR